MDVGGTGMCVVRRGNPSRCILRFVGVTGLGFPLNLTGVTAFTSRDEMVVAGITMISACIPVHCTLSPGETEIFGQVELRLK
jgi:hypothetical protein